MVVSKIIEKLKLNPNKQLSKPIRGLDGFNVEELVTALVHSSSIREAAELLGYSEAPVKKYIRELFSKTIPERSYQFGSGGKAISWRFTLLSLIEHKYCVKCNRILPFANFGSHIGNDSTNLSSECSTCHVHRTKLQKLDINKRTPSWANLSKIQEIYNNCPEGFHVDHIIPLRGKNVSGLHIETNLQYLWAEDNLKKSNTWD